MTLVDVTGTKIGKLRGDEKIAHALFPERSNDTRELTLIQAMRREGFMKGSEYKAEFYEELIVASTNMARLWNSLMAPDSESCRAIVKALSTMEDRKLRDATMGLSIALKRIAHHMEESKR